MIKSRTILYIFSLSALLVFTQCFTEKQNQGKRLYEAKCQSCHMEDGSGLRGIIPPIAGADYLVNNRNNLPCLIRHGIKGTILVNGIEYDQPMPGSENLREDEITNLLNYIQTNFGNNNERYTFPEVEGLLNNCPPTQP